MSLIAANNPVAETAGSPTEMPTARAWYVAIALCVAHAVSTLDRYVIVLVNEPLKVALGLSDAQLGLLQGTGFAILYCSVAVPLGSVADAVSRRNLIMAGISIWSLATIACAFATSFGQLFAARVLVGFGEACLVPAGMSLLASYFSRAKLARGVSVFSLGIPIGQALAFLGGASILALGATQGFLSIPVFGEVAPWRVLFVVSGLGAIPALLLMLAVREPARATVDKGKTAAALAHMREGLRYLKAGFGRYVPFLAVGSAVACSGYAFVSWSASLLVRLHGASPAEAGALVGTAGLIAGPAGTIFGGILLERLQARRVAGAPLVHMAAAAVAALVALLAFLLAPGIGTAGLALGLFLGISTLMVVPLYVGIQLLTDPHKRGIVASFNMMIYTLFGLGFGPAAVGLVSDWLPEGDTSLGLAVLIVVGAMAAIAVPVTLRYRHAFDRAAANIAIGSG